MITQRRLSVGERIMYVAETEAINCIFPFSLNGLFNEDQIQAALNKLQQKHPLLRAVIKQVNGYPSFILPENAPVIPITIYDRFNETQWLNLIKKSWQDYFRSEEHTSELQSRENLVCRLLL